MLLSALLCFAEAQPAYGRGLWKKGAAADREFLKTKEILQRAYLVEIVAYRRYVLCVGKALEENYRNIGYVFHAFSFSERIHARNYESVLDALGRSTEDFPLEIEIGDTKENLQKAAQNEMEKIERIYPDFLKGLEKESHEDAILNCMYSWKSHRQHEEKIAEILKYSGSFFGSVAKEIEDMALDFHVCGICGSTLDKEPQEPCVICNRSLTNYRRIERPEKT